MIVLRFFGSKCRETVQPSARISTHSFFDLRMKMLGEMLDHLIRALCLRIQFGMVRKGIVLIVWYGKEWYGVVRYGKIGSGVVL